MKHASSMGLFEATRCVSSGRGAGAAFCLIPSASRPLVGGLALLGALVASAFSVAAAQPFLMGGRGAVPPAQVQKIAVFGRDDRRRVPASQTALQDKIGMLINRRTRSICTAFCVGPDLVATAGHCLFGTDGGTAPRLADLGFRLASAPPQSFVRIRGASSGTAPQHVASGSMTLRIRPPIDATKDWALIRLTKAACKAGALTLSRRTPDALLRPDLKNKIYHVAFHRDFPGWRLAEDRSCTVRRSFPPADWTSIVRDFTGPQNLILHSCDTGGASSGSPLLIDGPTGPEVVGINVGTYVQSKVLMREGSVLRRYKAQNVANTGVSTRAFRDALSVFEKADILASSKEIKSLQELLAWRGLYRGAHDGAYGPQTRSAIAGFERLEGQPVTGLATLATLRQLSAQLAAAKEQLPASSLPDIETGSIGLHRTTQSPSSPARP